MPTIKIKNSEGKDAGSLQLSDAIFGAEPNLNSIRASFAHIRATNRTGTHSTKTRAYVSGGGKKPWKQKGTGRARQGSTRAVQWRHGAIAFGPTPRKYGFHLNRKIKRGAIRSVLADFAKSERLIVIDDLSLEAPKTKQLAAILAKVGAAGPTLLLTEKTDPKILLSARNLPFIEYAPADQPNIKQFLASDWVVATKAAVKRLEEVLA